MMSHDEYRGTDPSTPLFVPEDILDLPQSEVASVPSPEIAAAYGRYNQMFQNTEPGLRQYDGMTMITIVKQSFIEWWGPYNPTYSSFGPYFKVEKGQEPLDEAGNTAIIISHHTFSDNTTDSYKKTIRRTTLNPLGFGTTEKQVVTIFPPKSKDGTWRYEESEPVPQELDTDELHNLNELVDKLQNPVQDVKRQAGRSIAARVITKLFGQK